MQKIKSIFLILILVVSFSLQAASASADENKENLNYLGADVFVVLISGIGLEYQYAFTRQFSIGPSFFFGKIRTTSSSVSGVLDEDEHQITKFGVMASYSFTSISEAGAYLTFGVDSAQIKSNIKDFGGSEYESTASKVGPVVGIGYQFVGRSLGEMSKLLIRTALVYGNGYAVKYSYDPTKTTPFESEVYNSVWLQVILGLSF